MESNTALKIGDTVSVFSSALDKKVIALLENASITDISIKSSMTMPVGSAVSIILNTCSVSGAIVHSHTYSDGLTKYEIKLDYSPSDYVKQIKHLAESYA